MALAVVGRQNLVGAGYCPAMKDEGILLYQNGNTVRRVVMGVGDSALATNGTNGTGYWRGKIVGNYYIQSADYNLYFVHKDTGVSTQIPRGTGWEGYDYGGDYAEIIRASGVPELVWNGYGAPGEGQSDHVIAWSPTPDHGVAVGHRHIGTTYYRMLLPDQNFPDGAAAILIQDPNAGVRIESATASAAVNTGIASIPTSVEGHTLHYQNNAEVPWKWGYDGTYFYYFGYLDYAQDHYHLVIFRQHKTTHAVDYDIWLDLLEPNWNRANFISAIGYDTIKKKLYWGTNHQQAYRVYAANTGEWPFSQNHQTCDTDTGAAGFGQTGSVQAFFVFHPYLYVAKLGGNSYGPQLVKIFDEDLILRTPKTQGYIIG